MSKVFKIIPKRIKRTNGTVLTPEMEITVTTVNHTSDPFYNGAQEIKETYMRLYNFDYKKANCSKVDFEFYKLD
jgi:ribosomal protein L31